MAESTNPVQQVQDKLKAVQKLLPLINSQRLKVNSSFESINKTHEQIKAEEKLSSANKSKLQDLYPEAIAEAERQEASIRQALEKIYEIREIRNERARQARQMGNKETIRRGTLMKHLQTSAQTIPLFVPHANNEKPPPLCGAIPSDHSYAAKPGDMVAALSRGKDGENWILAEVVIYHPSSGKYELDDIDEEQKERLSLSKRRVIPLPTMRANPLTNANALFKKDTVVMALYPQTTCFYKALVQSPPLTATDEYEVLFEDPTYPDGYSPPLKVAQRYVIAVRDKKSKN